MRPAAMKQCCRQGDLRQSRANINAGNSRIGRFQLARPSVRSTATIDGLESGAAAPDTLLLGSVARGLGIKQDLPEQ